jgi:hypothetical protein
MSHSGYSVSMFPRSHYIGVERGLAEFRCGRPVVILGDQCIAAMPVDGCNTELLQGFRVTFDVTAVKLAVSARRACAWDQNANTSVNRNPKRIDYSRCSCSCL